jgi:glutamate racemase
MNQPITRTLTPCPTQAIGILDSGVGGISVLKHIQTLLPKERLFYVADSLFAPYGNKSAEEIQTRCEKIADFLIEKNVKALVVACNTATAAAISHLRSRYDLPIVGMEPAVKPAAKATKNGIVGVLATTGTLKSAQFAALLESYGQQVQVVTQACVGLVECVERGELNSAHTIALLRGYCQPLLDAGADTIVLGCTHYPFLKPVIAQIVGTKVVLIDTGEAVARQLQRRLYESHLLANDSSDASFCPRFWTNSQHIEAALVIRQLWGDSAVEVNRADF